MVAQAPWTPQHVAETPGSMPWERGPHPVSVIQCCTSRNPKSQWSKTTGNADHPARSSVRHLEWSHWAELAQALPGQSRGCPESSQSRGLTGGCGRAPRMLYSGGGSFLPHVGLPPGCLNVLLTWGLSSPQSGNSKGRLAELQGHRCCGLGKHTLSSSGEPTAHQPQHNPHVAKGHYMQRARGA